MQVGLFLWGYLYYWRHISIEFKIWLAFLLRNLVLRHEHLLRPCLLKAFLLDLNWLMSYYSVLVRHSSSTLIKIFYFRSWGVYLHLKNWLLFLKLLRSGELLHLAAYFLDGPYLRLKFQQWASELGGTLLINLLFCLFQRFLFVLVKTLLVHKCSFVRLAGLFLVSFKTHWLHIPVYYEILLV